MTTDVENTAKTSPAAATDMYEDTPPAHPAPASHRGALVIASAALALALTSPYWSVPVYKALHLRPPGVEWQARQEVETGRHGQSLAELDRRLADLGGAIAKANEQVAGIKAAQTAIETQVGVMALLQIRAAMRRPVPFEAELKLVRALGGKYADLDPLFAAIEPYAVEGIPLESQLQLEFPYVAEAVARTGPRPSMLNWLVSFTGWAPEPAHPTGADGKPDPTWSVIEHAQARLADHDLRGAVEDLGTLDGDAAAATRSWLGQAQARLAANQAIDRIAEHAATAMSRVPPRS
ncbi:COG4223 family protein [Azospirillum sp. sgz301742]